MLKLNKMQGKAIENLFEKLNVNKAEINGIARYVNSVEMIFHERKHMLKFNKRCNKAKSEITDFVSCICLLYPKIVFEDFLAQLDSKPKIQLG